MSDNLDQLADRWKKNPDADTTIQLCGALRGSVRMTLVQQVGSLAVQKHASNVPVLLAVAKMYMMTQRLAEAQSVLVAAGKISPREGMIYRTLGEILLRRGDAARAEKVFERAVSFGADNDETRMWLERTRVYKAMQAKAGSRAVASEVARTVPLGGPPADGSVKPPPIPAAEKPGMRGPLESLDLEDQETAIRGGAPVPPALPPGAVVAPPAGVSPPPIPAAKKPPPPMKPLAASTGEVLGMPPIPAPAIHAPSDRRFSPTAPTSGNQFDPMDVSITDQLKQEEKDGIKAAAARIAAAAAAANLTEDGPTIPLDASAKPAAPHAQDVLDALALAGVFEPPSKGAAPLIWDRAEKQKKRGMIPLIALIVLLIGGSIGTYRYVSTKRAIAHGEAEVLLTQIDADLRSGEAKRLPDMEEKFKRVFDLDSRSDHASLSWLKERAMTGLLKGGQDVAFQDSLDRAKETGVKEDKSAFAQVAAFLFLGDTVGAAGLLSKWDTPAGQDAFYQLFAGATLERAGDGRARERYEASIRLDPELIPAQIALARSMAIDGDVTKAAELAKDFRTKHPDRAEGQALVALAWARDPMRADQPPPEVDETLKNQDLPISLRFVPHALGALIAQGKHDDKAAKEAVDKGLAVVEVPGVATWLGLIAIETGDETLARKAALSAVSFSAVYPPARVLAARVALLGARLDEGLKATEELDPTSPDVAVVRAAAAYERVDSVGLGAALDAVSIEARKLPFLTSLNLAQDALAGRAEPSGLALVSLATEDSPWSDLVAMDIALDAGDLETAHKIADAWKGTEDRPLRALRLARLARWDGKTDDADKLSLLVIQGSTVTTRALGERVFALVAAGKAADAGPLLARYPLVLGPLAGWLSAYAKAGEGKLEDARGKTATLDPPPPQAPLPARILVAATLGALKDRRRGPDFVRDLFNQGVLAPDVVKAGEALGVAPGPRPKPRARK
jgi:Tfp pilus assembly protein PilF